MHVQQPLRSRPLVKIVDVLRDEQELAGPLRVEPCKRHVPGVGLDGPEPLPPRIVEGVHQRGIAPVRFGRRDILDTVALPQPVRAAECGETALGRHARARQDHDVPEFVANHDVGLTRTPATVESRGPMTPM